MRRATDRDRDWVRERVDRDASTAAAVAVAADDIGVLIAARSRVCVVFWFIRSRTSVSCSAKPAPTWEQSVIWLHVQWPFCLQTANFLFFIVGKDEKQLIIFDLTVSCLPSTGHPTAGPSSCSSPPHLASSSPSFLSLQWAFVCGSLQRRFGATLPASSVSAAVVDHPQW